MPTMDLTSDNKRNSGEAFPKMMLDMDERKRIILLEKAPTVGYVHTLRAPQIGEDGKPVMEVQKARRSGQEDRVVNKMDFIGRHLCLGTFTVLQTKGADPDNCPTCAAAKKSDAIAAADRRFAVNVGEYAVKPGTFSVREPFSMEITVWSFGDQIFNKLVDLTGEWGDLRMRDLNLGPCIQKQFQRFDINVAATAEWLASEQRKAFVKELYTSSRCEDLDGQIGRKTPRQFIEEDIDKVLKRHKQAHGATDTPESEAAQVASANLDNLLSEPEAKTEREVITISEETGPPPAEAIAPGNLDDLLGDVAGAKPADDKPIGVITPEGETKPVPEKSLAAEELDAVHEPEKPGSGEAIDLDALLA